MATRIHTGFWPRTMKFFFGGNESRYELWEVKFFGYHRIQQLHQIILLPTDQNDDMDFVEKNSTVFSELIQCLDDRSLSLVMKDAKDNVRKALAILREYYLSKGKLKVVSLYLAHIFEKTGIKIYHNYIIRAENISNSLKEAEVISKGLLITIVLKGLSSNFKPLAMVITQKKKNLTFSEFKVCLRSYHNTEHMLPLR